MMVNSMGRYSRQDFRLQAPFQRCNT